VNFTTPRGDPERRDLDPNQTDNSNQMNEDPDERKRQWIERQWHRHFSLEIEIPLTQKAKKTNIIHKKQKKKVFNFSFNIK